MGWLFTKLKEEGIEDNKDLLEALDEIISFLDEFRELSDTMLSNLSASETIADCLDRKVRELTKKLTRATEVNNK